MLPNEYDDMIAVGPCVRCLNPFTFNASTVPSVLINPATRCSLNLDGSPVTPGPDRDDAYRMALCPPCAEVHVRSIREPVRIVELFPHAKFAVINFPCECDHGEFGHHRTDSGNRTYCLHQNAAGQCGCRMFRLHPRIPRLSHPSTKEHP